MKKFLKVTAIVFLGIFAVTSAAAAIIFLTPSKIEFDVKKLAFNSDFISFYDEQNIMVSNISESGRSAYCDAFDEKTKQAFIAVEDKNFYSHNGVDFKRMIKAMLVNIKNRSYKQGASTISQQLIKNTHLSSEKTLARKIDEIKLAFTLERNYTKDQIITMYLNTIYFGENCFGLSSAAEHYFGKTPGNLELSEVALLAGIISAPSRLNPNADKEAARNKRNIVLTKMHEQGYIDSSEMTEAINSPVVTVSVSTADYASSYFKAALNELEETQSLSPYSLKNCKVITYYNDNLQQEFASYESESDYQAIMVDNKTCGIIAYFSTAGEIGREIASCAKPILVYAPALEENFITEYTKISDEPTDFNGYKPSNYGDKYYGMVSVKEALSKSLNIPAVKILDGLGVKKAVKYATKLNIPIKNEGLSVALGNTSTEIRLKDIAAAYTTFANYGIYKKCHFIKKIINSKNKVIYENQDDGNKVFSESTCSAITDMLLMCAKSGTAKKLSYLDFQVAAKTGTSGTDKGNTDCYAIGYTTEHTGAVWLGNKDYSPMLQSKTGSNEPTYLLAKYLDSLYTNKKPTDFEYKGLVKVAVDKISYEKDGKILIADDNAPTKYISEFYLRKENTVTEKSDRFSSFKTFTADCSFTGSEVNFTFNLPEYADVRLYRTFGEDTELVYEGKENYCESLDDYGVYEYTAIYTISGKTKIESEKQLLIKIKYEKENTDGKDTDGIPDDWWNG